ncbi:MAG TPA: xanthine dehydrogenase family protein subunit M [Candidatus Limnocylindrales bacterium]|nr:xanthine dehydrogenase family protein subunit M [Candidatus Limnocylindrales bacterium]
MQAFAYARPGTLTETFGLLEEHGTGASLLAGGTDLVVALRNRTLRPSLVVDLKGVAELKPAIAESGPSLTISAGTVLTDLGDDPRIQAQFPALVEAAATVGSNQIRNRATLTGNICHASPAADTAPALLVYGAAVNIASAGGTRRVALDEFFLGPGKTVIQLGEVVTSIDVPMPTERCGAAFARITRRRGVDLATISLCCLVDASGTTRFAFGAVGPRPFLVIDQSGALADPATGDADKDEILRRLLAQSSPISDVRGSSEYRSAMLLVMSRRALRASIARLRAA